MYAISSTDVLMLSIRVGPGEDLFSALYEAVDGAGLASASVVAVAGSAEQLSYGVVSIAADDVPRYTEVLTVEGAIEFTGLQGHVGQNADGSPTCHLHGTFGLPDGSVVAGHVYSARALVTIEMTLIGSPHVTWTRSAEKYKGDHAMPVLLPVELHEAPA